MGEHDEQDPDRAAIMARRRQFIAVALGGLASGCSPGKPTPQPVTTGESATATSTSTTSITTAEESEASEAGDTGSESSETGPQACLKFDLPPPGTDSGDESDTGDETDSGTETGPRPCLAPPGALP